jgi:hypothetical protein
MGSCPAQPTLPLPLVSEIDRLQQPPPRFVRPKLRLAVLPHPDALDFFEGIQRNPLLLGSFVKPRTNAQPGVDLPVSSNR